MLYTLSPFRWIVDEGPPRWQGPGSALDLRTLAQQSQAGWSEGLGVFVCVDSYEPTKEDVVLGSGMASEIRPDAKIVDALTVNGYRPQGETLADLLWDLFTNGSDPLGLDAPRPLMPTTQRVLELHCGDRKAESFVYGQNPHTNRVEAVLQAGFRELFEAADRGGLKDVDHHRRVLDYWCDKYRLDKSDRASWEKVIPPDLREHVEGPLKHETTITETFNTSDSDTLGPNLTWAEVTGDWDVVSNAASRVSATSAARFARAESDLSSVDHYCQVKEVSASDMIVGPCARFSASAITCYSTNAFSNQQYLVKYVAGAQTTLPNYASTWATGRVVKVTINGSTLSVAVGGTTLGSTTDTSITTGLRGGMQQFTPSAAATLDDFEAADLAAGGVVSKSLMINQAVQHSNSF